MEEKELKELREELSRRKKIEDLAAEREKNKYFKYMEELSKNQCTEYNVSKMLEYEKLIFDYLAEKYREISVTKKLLLSKLNKAGYNLTGYSAVSILPSHITERDGMRGEDNIAVKPRKDKRDIIEKFITAINLEEIGIKVFENDKSNEIKFMDVLIFSLFYIYEDGREFEKHSNDTYYFDYYKTKKVYKEKRECYFLVLEKVLELFSKDFFDKASFFDRLYASAQLHKIDNLFKFFKVYRMSGQKEEILAAETRRKKAEIYSSLGCEEVEEIIDAFNSNVFKDEEFVKFCIETEYPDPFGYFKSVVYEATTRNARFLIEEKYNISKLLDECKKITKERIEQELKTISINLCDDFFDSINAIHNLCFEPKNESARNYKKSVEKLIQKFYNIKYADINKLFDSCESMHYIFDESEFNREWYEYFKSIMFIPDRTNFLNMLYNTEYNEEQAKKFIGTDEKIKEYVDKAFEFDKRYHSFWEDYYFGCRDTLKNYMNSWPESDENYMKFLFEIVIANLNEKCVLTDEK